MQTAETTSSTCSDGFIFHCQVNTLHCCSFLCLAAAAVSFSHGWVWPCRAALVLPSFWRQLKLCDLTARRAWPCACGRTENFELKTSCVLCRETSCSFLHFSSDSKHRISARVLAHVGTGATDRSIATWWSNWSYGRDSVAVGKSAWDMWNKLGNESIQNYSPVAYSPD